MADTKLATRLKASAPKPSVPASPALSPVVLEAEALLRRAEAGDESAMPRLRQLFDHPEIRIKARLNVEELALQTVAGKLMGRDLAGREMIVRKVAQVAAELAGPNPSPIEKMLADRAAFCWHVVSYYERDYHCQGQMSLKQADYHQRRITAAHKRYLSALKTLATVRKLAVPAIMVNAARNQVVVAGR